MIFRYIAIGQSFLIMLSTLFGIWIIFKTKKRIRNQDYSSKRFSVNQSLILALFCAHFMVGLTRFSYHTTFICLGYKTLARILEVCFMTILFIEMLFTTFIPIERYFTIRFPFHSASNEAFYRKFYLGIIPVTFTILVGVLKYLFGFIVPIVCSVLGILTILVCNFLLFRIVRKQTKKIVATAVCSPKIANIIQNSIRRTKPRQISESERRRKLQKRSLKICALMTLTYVFLWVPYFIFNFLYQNVNENVYGIYFGIVGIFSYMNPTIDVLIYLLWNTDTRKTLRVIFGKLEAITDNKESLQITNATASSRT